MVMKMKKDGKMSDLISRQAAIDAVKDAIISAEQPYAEDALRKLPFTEPERKTKIEMNWATYFDNMGTAVIHIPYSYKCGNCGCQLQRTYNGIDINYCPECGYKLEWK